MSGLICVQTFGHPDCIPEKLILKKSADYKKAWKIDQ